MSDAAPATTPVTAPSARSSLTKGSFWNYGGLFFFYFAIWQLAFTFLPRWLETEAGMGSGARGLVSSVMALTAFCLQPFYGYVQDRLGLRKHLFAFVVLMGALTGPFFAFVFVPVAQANEYLGAVVGGIFLSLSLNAGVGIVEAFNERSSRALGFEYGHVRLFGSVAGALASLVGGFIWASDPDNVWWAGSFSAVVLGVLLFVARTPRTAQAAGSAAADAAERAESRVSMATVRQLLTNRSFVGFMVLMFGTAALYDVFDQQFPNYFARFVTGGIDPQVLFSRIVFVQILAEALIMVVTPFIINKIGAKNGLMIFGAILVVRVLGSALFTDTSMLILWRLLAAVEMPFMLISVMKYITRMFDVRISATAYMIGFNMAKQVGIVLFSAVFGFAYDAIGFGNTYLIMTVVIVAVTVAAALIMRDDRHHALPGTDGTGGTGGPARDDVPVASADPVISGR
jgi:OHS family lactose permease-like MFS transporter